MNESEFASLEAKTDDSETAVEFQQLSAIIKSFVALPILSEKWNFLGGRDDLLRIEMAPDEFVAALEQECTSETLVKLGVYERVDDELRLSSSIEGVDNLYVAIDETKQTLGFSGGNEFLFPKQRRALDYAAARIPPDSTQAPDTLFIVDSPDAVELMQRLGLQAVSCEGLNALDCHDVKTLFSGDLQTDFGWRYFLVLLDFDVAQLVNGPSSAIEKVINRLADAQRVYGTDPARRFGVCRPTADEFECLERTIAFKDAALIRQVFENWSAAAKRVTVGSWRSYFAVATPSFSAASTALNQALQQPNRCFRDIAVRDALPAYRAAGKGAVMQKFHDAIDRATDPFDHLDLVAAADYAEAFLDDDPLVRAGEAVLAGKFPPSARELREESFAQRQRCMAELRRIRRDLKGKR